MSRVIPKKQTKNPNGRIHGHRKKQTIPAKCPQKKGKRRRLLFDFQLNNGMDQKLLEDISKISSSVGMP